MTNTPRGARTELGKIEHIDPRKIWVNEALDFTPWLRDHQEQLAEALQIDVEIGGAEAAVGGFSVDMVGRDLTNDRSLIVENQLEQTDHNHLGQLLTYASGLNAATVVWISPAFREEHRQALDWLNSHTDDEVNFFGLELEVIQIANSQPAANLRAVAMPNEWASRARRLASASSASPKTLARQRFLQAALDELKRRDHGLTNATTAGPQSWFSMSAGRTNFSFNWAFTGDGRLRVELYIDTLDPSLNLAYLASLESDRGSIEGALGVQLDWERLEGRRAVRVSIGRPLGALAPDEDGALLEWAVTTMLAFHRVFRPLIRALTPPATVGAADSGTDPLNGPLD